MSAEQQKPSQSIEEMQARTAELVQKDALSPTELKEFIYLLWDQNSLEKGEEISYDYNWRLPSRKQPTIDIYTSEPDENNIDIILMDGLKIPTDSTWPTGEFIRLSETDGQLQWQTGVFNSYYSRFLKEQVLLNESDMGEPVFSKSPLAPDKCAKVAKTVWQAYQARPKETP